MTAQFQAPIAVRFQDWTPRQKQVLDLLMRGQTNSQIAKALDISLDGAKWHVGEIISRLGVDSREEAADYWRTQNGLPARLFRVLRGLWPSATAAKVVSGGVAAGLVAGLAVAVIVAWPGPAENDAPENLAGVPIPSPNLQDNLNGFDPRRALTDGTSGYAYEPALAYLSSGGEVELVDGVTGANPARFLDGCSGLASAKQAILTSGLQWSANGGQLNCLNDDLTVRGVSSNATTADAIALFAANECLDMSSVVVSPLGDSAVCSGPNGPILRTTDGSTVPLGKVRGASAYAPNGAYLIVPGDVVATNQPGVSRLSWEVYTTDGTLLGSITDAFAASPDTFTWTLDGARLAYPGEGGATIIDIENGFKKNAFPLQTARTGPRLTWVLNDSALLSLQSPGQLISASTGAQQSLPTANYYGAAIAPDGRHVAVAVVNGSTGGIAIVDLEAATLTAVPGSQFAISVYEGGAAQFVFSGDSSRLCWQTLQGGRGVVSCADIAGDSAFIVKAPVQSEPDVSGGDVLWRAFSPDLTRVAYTNPGPANVNAPQTLWIADLDGSNAIEIGPAQGALPYSWQPDGVYRQ